MDEQQGDDANAALERILLRSDALHEAIALLLDNAEFDDSLQGEACFGMCSLSLEHAQGIRLLMVRECPTSAVGLLRLQFEAVVRAMWLLYAASDADISKLTAPLTISSQKSANALPSVSEMIGRIGKNVGTKAPAAAHQMLVHFKDVSWDAMNSFVHGGLHPLRRHMDGFPLAIAMQIVKNSNALSTMAGMTLAILTCDERRMKPMSKIQWEFADCLPDLLT